MSDSNTPDYQNLDYPEPVHEEDGMDDWHWTERRAYLHDLLADAQHPRQLEYSQTELAEFFGVTQPAISDDFKRLREYRREIVGRFAVASTELLAEEAVQELRENGEWREAWNTQQEYVEWLFDMGELEKEPDKLDVDIDAKDAYLEMLRDSTNDED